LQFQLVLFLGALSSDGAYVFRDLGGEAKLVLGALRDRPFHVFSHLLYLLCSALLLLVLHASLPERLCVLILKRLLRIRLSLEELDGFLHLLHLNVQLLFCHD